jgi:DNA polymerase (family 10)
MSNKFNIKGVNDTKHSDMNKLAKQLEPLPTVTKLGLLYSPQISVSYETMSKIISKFYTLDEKLLKKSIVTGSYRRESKVCNDIDIVYWGNEEKLISLLSDPSTFVITSRGKQKITGIFMTSICNVYCDIWLATPKNKYAMILYTTGSKTFNIVMRKKAKDSGYLLNQEGLFYNNKQIAATSERKYFELLDMKYLEPNHRSYPDR